MNIFAALRTALRALRKNKLRSFLAALGIVIAVAAVIATVAIGEGAKAKVADQMASLGSNLLMILPGSVMQHGAATGAGAVRGWPLADGEAFGREEDAAAAKVCLIGQTVKDKLFGDSPAVGEQIRVRHVPCKVVGVLSAKGQSSWGQDQDDVVLMPWTTLVRRIIGSQSDAVGQLMVSARSPQSVSEAQREITSLLKQRHHQSEQSEPDFQVRNLAEMQNAAQEQTKTIALLLGSVALISLIVGAIGIANVMLVSVTERTREIGIRMAVGARGRDVMFQFLTEAVVLAAVGGAIGLFLGTGVAKYMAIQAQWPTLLSPPVMIGTMILAGLAGIIAGFYPALRASRLDPIDALRFE